MKQASGQEACSLMFLCPTTKVCVIFSNSFVIWVWWVTNRWQNHVLSWGLWDLPEQQSKGGITYLIHTRTYIPTHMYMCICVYVYVCMCIYISEYINPTCSVCEMLLVCLFWALHWELHNQLVAYRVEFHTFLHIFLILIKCAPSSSALHSFTLSLFKASDSQ